eukprot:SAG11_NODE_18697_length_483_cov_2.000000_1_plen_27_part_01
MRIHTDRCTKFSTIFYFVFIYLTDLIN